MKILTVVGARPQFVKAAAVSRELRKKHTEILVHTGQHYDADMSQVFFEELSIPAPDYNLGVGSASHARQTAQMMIGIEDVLLSEKPDAVLLYGDTNSTLAGSVTAAKLGIPVAHVEAGVRCGVFDMPEEQNRIVTDHLARWNFAPSQDAVENLQKENITNGVYNVGDVMFDAMLYYGGEADKLGHAEFLSRLHSLDGRTPDVREGNYYLATMHRPENVDSPEHLAAILDSFELLDAPVLFAIHPRTQARMKEFGLSMSGRPNTFFVSPMGYIEMIYFTKHAKKVVTDSGGLHKEAYLWKVPGVVVLRSTAWIETLAGSWNVLASPDARDIASKAMEIKPDPAAHTQPYGDGTASKKITEVLSV